MQRTRGHQGKHRAHRLSLLVRWLNHRIHRLSRHRHHRISRQTSPLGNRRRPKRNPPNRPRISLQINPRIPPRISPQVQTRMYPLFRRRLSTQIRFGSDYDGVETGVYFSMVSLQDGKLSGIVAIMATTLTMAMAMMTIIDQCERADKAERCFG